LQLCHSTNRAEQHMQIVHTFVSLGIQRIQPGNKISAKTLDLSLPFAKIAAQLNKIADCVKIC
jgi:hypothetical protein